MPISTRIVHFTGYEVPLDLLRVADARDRLAGHLLGTADMLAQMADRCYLEKCRDRLYAEFVLGDVAVHAGAEGVKVLYGSGLDLLRQTPKFIASTIDNRLGTAFGHSYRYVEPLYGGDNPYMNAIRQNVQYLNGLTRGSRWPMLRRNPPVFTVESNAMDGVRTLLVRHLKEVFGAPRVRRSARPDAREARTHAGRRVHVEHVALADHGQPAQDLRLPFDARAGDGSAQQAGRHARERELARRAHRTGARARAGRRGRGACRAGRSRSAACGRRARRKAPRTGRRARYSATSSCGAYPAAMTRPSATSMSVPQ